VSRLAIAAAGGCAALAIAACGVIPGPPPPLDANFIPEAVSPTFDPTAVTSDGFTTEQHLAVRIRVQTCDGWATGSGWILSDHEVVTNRHVVEGGTRIEVTTYDGRDFTVTSSQLAPVADLALLTLDSVFTETAEYEITSMRSLDPTTIVGYPSGEQLVVEEGHYLSAEMDGVGDSKQLVWQFRLRRLQRRGQGRSRGVRGRRVPAVRRVAGGVARPSARRPDAVGAKHQHLLIVRGSKGR